MKKLLFVLSLIVLQIVVNAQSSLIYHPLDYYQRERPPLPAPPPVRVISDPTINNYYNNDDSKSKPIDFDNATLIFFKVRHMTKIGETTISDETTTAPNRKFIIRTNYIVDEENNVWDIKEKKYNSDNDMMNFYCTRNNAYESNFLIKMDGTTIAQYWEAEGKKIEIYVSF